MAIGKTQDEQGNGYDDPELYGGPGGGPVSGGETTPGGLKGGEHFDAGSNTPWGQLPADIAVNVDAGNSETPRERAANQNPGGGGVTSTPKKPMTPTPMAGQQSNYGGPREDDTTGTSLPTGVVPFRPLSSPTPGAAPSLSGPIGSPSGGSSALFGQVGGLQGGGLGVPQSQFDPHAGGDTSSIDQLIASLMKQKRGLF